MSCPRVRRILLSAAALTAVAVVQGAEDTQFRYQASIAVERPGAFVQLPLKADTYAHSLEPGLLDLRVVDANGERVPFAVLGPRGNQVETIDQARDAAIYPLPPKPSADGSWTAPIELSVVGDRINVTRRGGPPPEGAGGPRSGGWLVDLGQRARTDPPPRAVRFEWSGPAEFTAAFQFETSDDKVTSSSQVKTVAADVAMHITATKPLALDKDGIDPKIVAQERAIYADQVKNKPAAIIDKIVDGKLGKFYADTCLLLQPFVKDDSKTVAQVVNEAAKQAGGTAKIVRFVRFEVGGQ